MKTKMGVFYWNTVYILWVFSLHLLWPQSGLLLSYCYLTATTEGLVSVLPPGTKTFLLGLYENDAVSRTKSAETMAGFL